jgi:diguanylate cyclase (GGDEF)-like protein
MFLCFFWASPSQAQAQAPAAAAPTKETPAALRTITTAREAHSLSSTEAARAYPIHLRAVATYIDPAPGWVTAAMFVHDSTGDIFVKPLVGQIRSLVPGTLLDIQGVSSPGEFAPIVDHPQIKVLGYAGLPPATERPSLMEMQSGVDDAKWIQVEGVVHSVVEESVYANLQLTMADGVINVMQIKGPGDDYSHLIDAKVRISGHAGPVMDTQRRHLIGARMQSPNLSSIEILEAAPADPFKLPVLPIDGLLRWDSATSLAHRVHVRGRVTLQWPGSSLCITDGTRAICAQTTERTPLRNGSLVDVAGFASALGGSTLLTDAIYKSAAEGADAPVAALPVTPENAIGGSYDSQLIQIDGHLISRDLTSSDTTLLLASGNSIFTAILPRSLGGPEANAWKDGSVLRLTGICSVVIDEKKSAFETGTAVPMTFRLLLRSPADIVVLRKPSLWTPEHLVSLLGLALGGTLAVLIWVVILRRRIRESEERFRHLAQHDNLTGLATRLLLKDRLNMALEAARRNQTGLTLMMVDLDYFKEINDNFGHAAGDEILRVTAHRLLECVRKSDTVARVGGDEFVVLLPGCGDRQAAEETARKLVADLAVPFSLELDQAPVTVSVGVCISPTGNLDAESLMKNADAALYQAKENGRNRFEIFTAQMEQLQETSEG